jgi:hypothetical protein
MHAIAALFEGLHLASTASEELHRRSDMSFIDIDRQEFDRFAVHVIDLLLDHLWPADREFISFATHVLQKDSEVKEPATGHLELFRGHTGFHAQGEVALELSFKTL